MLNNCYTFNELKEKYNWNTTEGCIQQQIRYARNRGVNIEFAFKEGKSYFKILDDISDNDSEWKTYPLNPRYEVSIDGNVRVKETKRKVGSKGTEGYLVVTDVTQCPPQYYKIHRMVMETFNPIENSEMYVVDHINGIKDDNRFENLRWLTQRHNMEERDENYAILNKNYQKLIQKYGYNGLNTLFEAILNENSVKN